MQTANVKGKDDTYARRLHCLPRCRQLLRRRVVIVGVSLGACRRCRLSVWRSERRGIGARRDTRLARRATGRGQVGKLLAGRGPRPF